MSVATNKLHKRLRRGVGRAIEDYQMIHHGDRIMVCLSGGKDSYTMLDILMQLQKIAPVSYEIVAVNLDQKQPGFPAHILPEYLAKLGVEYHIINEDTYSTVKRVIPEGKTMCSLCSRLRRGILYKAAGQLGCNTLALGHHRDDILETLFLNMFHGGKLKAMPPKLRSDDGKRVLIRPLAYCKEADIKKFAHLQNYPIIPCNLCGGQDNLQRVQIKKMLNQWQQDFPGRIESLFKATQNIAPSQLLDRNLFDFAALDTAPDEAISSGHKDQQNSSLWLSPEDTDQIPRVSQKIPVVNTWFGLQSSSRVESTSQAQSTAPQHE